MTSTLPHGSTNPTPQLRRATLGGDVQSRKEQVALGILIFLPFAAVIAAVPVAWGGWLSWTDVAIAL
ncbi:MAG: hypothetical protein ABI873_04810, partial [Marmoricola sp.]